MAKVSDNAENYGICMQEGNCRNCPSYVGDGMEGLYCAMGKSKNKVSKSGCNCPECPLWLNNGLSGMYFCDRGAVT